MGVVVLFKSFMVFVCVAFVLLSCMHIINSLYGERNHVIAFGKTIEDDSTGKESKDATGNADKKLAIITFDDGKKGQIKYAKQILDAYGFPATFSIICNNVSKGGHLNWTDIQQLENGGYDIASHSMSHVKLEDIPVDVAKYEIGESKKCLLDNGIRNVKVFTYPKNGGSDDPFILKEVAKHYEMARTGNDPLEFLKCSLTNSSLKNKKIDCSSLGGDNRYGKYSISGWSHDAEREKNGYNDDQMLQRFIDVTESQTKYNRDDEINAIPVIIYHDIGPKSGFYTTSFELFKSEMIYLKDNGFVVTRLLDLI